MGEEIGLVGWCMAIVAAPYESDPYGQQSGIRKGMRCNIEGHGVRFSNVLAVCEEGQSGVRG